MGEQIQARIQELLAQRDQIQQINTRRQELEVAYQQTAGAIAGLNGYIESFHSRFRDEFLNREWLLNLREARVLIEDWRRITPRKDRIADWAISVPKAFSQHKSLTCSGPIMGIRSGKKSNPVTASIELMVTA